jgi:hypothetical protein
MRFAAAAALASPLVVNQLTSDPPHCHTCTAVQAIY